MRSRASFVVAAVGVAFILSACSSGGRPSAQGPGANAPAAGPSPAATASAPLPDGASDAELAARFAEICKRAGGACGVAVEHVETGRLAEFDGEKVLPLFSVFKLPLVVEVLKQVEEGRLRLDQKIKVMPSEVSPGLKMNSDLWREPSERTVEELIEFSIARSDNTSSDKMLELVGGPRVVTERMRALGLPNIEVRSTVREFMSQKEHPNKGSATDIARLLARLRKGEVLQPPQLAVLLGAMGRATTGLQRIRAGVPAGTPVADKTGTGDTTTNDVGIVTLPEGKGHLAVAVLLDGSKLPPLDQEKVIAELTRAAYDAHVSR